jgi:hypothetical protein
MNLVPVSKQMLSQIAAVLPGNAVMSALLATLITQYAEAGPSRRCGRRSSNDNNGTKRFLSLLPECGALLIAATKRAGARA